MERRSQLRIDVISQAVGGQTDECGGALRAGQAQMRCRDRPRRYAAANAASSAPIQSRFFCAETKLASKLLRASA